MKPENIRPIPKYIADKIFRLDRKYCPEQKGACRFYSYLTKMKGELVKVTVAVKSRYRKQYIKQVAVHGVRSDKCLVRDMEYAYIGMGLRVGWYAEGLTKYRKWFEDGGWCQADWKYYNPPSVTVNREYIDRFPEYRYSAHRLFNGRCIVGYLRLYAEYPQAEYLLKAGLHKLHGSVTVLKRIAKDKKFCKWLIAHKAEITDGYCYIGAVMQAYKTGKPIKHIQAIEVFKKKLITDSGLVPVRELFGNDLERFFSYLTEKGVTESSYRDYLKACNYLGLDMGLSENRYPHNFKKLHDMRINQYHTAKALDDEKERAELYKQFAAVAMKYTALQKVKKGGLAVIIAKSPAELMHEGETLYHCVGKMGYDRKFAREETLIFFVRSSLTPDVPFVTVEYSLQSKKVLQCYGSNHAKPDDTVLHYVHNIWLPYANRTLKKLTA